MSNDKDSSVDFPGPVDNANLLDEDNTLKEHLIDESNYNLVPQEAWNILEENFGLATTTTTIKRKVIEKGRIVKQCVVEVYLTEVQLAHNDDPEDAKKAKFSKTDTLADVVAACRDVFSINEDIDVRLWYKYSANTYEMLPDLDKTVLDAGLFQGQLLLIEPKNSDGTWPRIAKNTSTALANYNNSNGVGANTRNYGYASASSSIEASEDKVQQGLCGLSNLGNTCFMNSIIQGLSNCPPVMEYFANDNYIEDINESNPLGNKGEIARSFGELLKSMWSGRHTYYVPRNFKMAVGKFAPQFSGYQQQDSQELLTFLLDGLHEDLNRIRQKPYIELKDSDNRPDDEVAAEAWATYKMRNDSVILDLFHGLLKSTVVCPECPKVSVTFDPFCYLSLPLPVRKERKIDLFLVYEDPTRCPEQFKVTVPKNGCMRDLCQALAGLSGVAEDKMIVTDVYNHRFHKIYTLDEGLSHILERDDIFVYEVATTDPDDPHELLLPVYLREKKSSLTYSPSNLFGQPLLMSVPKSGCTYEMLYELVMKRLSRYVQPPTKGEEWWRTENANKPKKASTSSPDMPTLTNEPSEEDTTPSSDGAPEVVDGVAASTKAESDSEDSDMMNVDEDEGRGRGPPKLFVMNFVNSYGNAQLEQLTNDGTQIKVSSRNYLSLDWHSRAKELFYNEKESENFTQDPKSFDSKPVQKKQVQLEECLELYTTKEKLGENDAWYCPACKKHQQATKKFDLWALPAMLVISLKRFSYNRYWRDKLDTHVEFPTRGLNMAPYIINPSHGSAVYDLVAVSNHYGGMGGGHCKY